MTPAKKDYEHKAGTTFRRKLKFTDANGKKIDMAGWTARMMLKTAYDATAPTVSLTTENGGITIDEEHSTLTILIDAAVTTTLTTTAKTTYLYDLEVVNSLGEVDSPLYGKFKVTPEVTK